MWCISWPVVQHYLYHIANASFLVAYCLQDGTRASLVRHSLLLGGYFLYSLWGWTTLCSPEMTAWYVLMVLLNVGQLLHSIYHMYPRKFPDHIEQLYQALFAPIKVPRTLFAKLVAGDLVESLHLTTDQCYAEEGVTSTERLAVLLSGSCRVTVGTNVLHAIGENEFIDSPEFISTKLNSMDTFKVTIKAAEPSRALMWTRASLQAVMVKEPALAQMMSALVARDIATKLQYIAHRTRTTQGSANVTDLRVLALAFDKHFNNTFKI